MEVEHFGHRLRHRVVYLADAFDILWQHQRLVSHVQPCHGQRHAGFQHHFGGFGIDIDVELCHRGGVAGIHTSPHKHDAFNITFQLWVLGQQQRDIGHGAGDHQRDRLRTAA
ncbi:hypothetical protein D3C76_1391770 [compost metagenome]